MKINPMRALACAFALLSASCATPFTINEKKTATVPKIRDIDAFVDTAIRIEHIEVILPTDDIQAIFGDMTPAQIEETAKELSDSLKTMLESGMIKHANVQGSDGGRSIIGTARLESIRRKNGNAWLDQAQAHAPVAANQVQLSSVDLVVTVTMDLQIKDGDAIVDSASASYVHKLTVTANVDVTGRIKGNQVRTGGGVQTEVTASGLIREAFARLVPAAAYATVDRLGSRAPREAVMKSERSGS